MSSINIKKVEKITGDYHELFLNILKDKKEAVAHLKAALDIYQEDNDKESLICALQDILDSQGEIEKILESFSIRKKEVNKEKLTIVKNGSELIESLNQ